jgi:hypothetical protein
VPSTGGWTSRKRRKGAQKVPDPYKRLRRQLERKRRLGHIRSTRIDEFPGVAYYTYSDDRIGIDLMLKAQLDWLPDKNELSPKHGG